MASNGANFAHASRNQFYNCPPYAVTSNRWKMLPSTLYSVAKRCWTKTKSCPMTLTTRSTNGRWNVSIDIH